MPGIPGGLERSRVLANSGKGRLRTLERMVFFDNVHLVLRTMLAEAAASLKLKGIDPIGPIRVRRRKKKTGKLVRSGGASRCDLAWALENTLLAKMLRDAVNDLV